ncbi:MAG: T9SS type A sorting domain-containing protein [Bacteroidia bacterium]|nr:T9SS type A sorting domain-containing protein [Bacteroidia bacterium]
MKIRFRFVFLFLSLIIKLASQTVFLPNIGTKWHYSFGNFTNGNTTNRKIEYISDSISSSTGERIQKLLAAKVTANDNSAINRKVFIKQRNDSVWFLHYATNNSWQLLFDYNATAAQSWTYSIMSGNFVNTHTVIVNSVSTINLNSQNLKKLNVTCKYGPQTYTTTILERIGAMVFLFNSVDYNPAYIIDGAYVKDLLCYEDSTFGLKQFTANSCDYSYYVGLNETIASKPEFNVYPNPSTSILNIQINDQISELVKGVKIKDVSGRVVLTSLSTNQIDIKGLNSGIYFISLYDKEKLIVTKKIVKE